MSKIELVRTALQTIINNIDCNNSNMPDEQCDEVLDMINKTTNAKEKLSKYQACKFLNKSRATFDNWVRDGKIPKGKRNKGLKNSFDLKRI